MAQPFGLAQATLLDYVRYGSVRLEPRVLPLRAQSAVDTPMPLRVAALAGPDRSLGAATMLLEVPGISIGEVRTPEDLVELVRRGGIAATVVDPELGGGWPVDVADQIVGGIQDLAPLILVCRCAADAFLIASRTARNGVSVLRAEALTSAKLGTIVTGAVAAHRARPNPGAQL